MQMGWMKRGDLEYMFGWFDGDCCGMGRGRGGSFKKMLCEVGRRLGLEVSLNHVTHFNSLEPPPLATCPKNQIVGQP